jgi:flagellar FliL protein
MTTPAADPKDKPKGKSKKGIIIGAVAAVVLLGGGGAYWMYAKPRDGKETKKEQKQPEPEGPGAAVAMEPFVVNLADPGGSSFLRVNLSLVVADEEQAKVFEESPVVKMKVRSQILELLALQHADQLITPTGKAELKKTIAASASKAVPEAHVSDVLFSEFVVQF